MKKIIHFFITPAQTDLVIKTHPAGRLVWKNKTKALPCILAMLFAPELLESD